MATTTPRGTRKDPDEPMLAPPAASMATGSPAVRLDSRPRSGTSDAPRVASTSATLSALPPSAAMMRANCSALSSMRWRRAPGSRRASRPASSETPRPLRAPATVRRPPLPGWWSGCHRRRPRGCAPPLAHRSRTVRAPSDLADAIAHVDRRDALGDGAHLVYLPLYRRPRCSEHVRDDYPYGPAGSRARRRSAPGMLSPGRSFTPRPRSPRPACAGAATRLRAAFSSCCSSRSTPPMPRSSPRRGTDGGRSGARACGRSSSGRSCHAGRRPWARRPAGC